MDSNILEAHAASIFSVSANLKTKATDSSEIPA
jgi:hypothetical protein